MGMRREPDAGPAVTLLPSGRRQPFPPGTILADALLDMGVAVKTPCGGRGTCGKCRVRIEGGPGEVLACRMPVTHDLAVYGEPEGPVSGLRVPGLGPDTRLSAAVDIGTTSVKAALVDTGTGTSFEVSSFLNPQRRFGHDVISRIAAARDPAASATLTGLIRRAVRRSLDSALAAAGRTVDSLESIVFSGNTTMLYMLFGLDVQPLGRYPYRALIRDFSALGPSAAGLPENVTTRITALPVLSAFIGADLIGGLALCSRTRGHQGVFFIDLGTNGELFVIDGQGRIFATSCAMGPALEGMNISWGMTADDGAITHIRETPDGLAHDMLGTGEPAGITGTALIDLLAILLDRGIVSPTGAFRKGVDDSVLPSPLVHVRGEDARALALWGGIRLTQADIRSVQLAKAASLAAAGCLLATAESRPEDVRHVYVAGALGEHMDMGRFRRLGFTPEFPHAHYEYLGNTSLQAAVQACLDPGFIEQARVLRDRTREVVLSEQKGFQDVFMESINFPGG